MSTVLLLLLLVVFVGFSSGVFSPSEKERGILVRGPCQTHRWNACISINILVLLLLSVCARPCAGRARCRTTNTGFSLVFVCLGDHRVGGGRVLYRARASFHTPKPGDGAVARGAWSCLHRFPSVIRSFVRFVPCRAVGTPKGAGASRCRLGFLVLPNATDRQAIISTGKHRPVARPHKTTKHQGSDSARIGLRCGMRVRPGVDAGRTDAGNKNRNREKQLSLAFS